MASNKEKLAPKNPRNFKVSLSEEQKLAKEQILKHSVSIINGVAGTGKTLLMCQILLDLFYKRKIDRITIMRPMVGTEDIGHLPGTVTEKSEPWIIPVKENMYLLEDKSKVDKMFEEGDIRVLPLQFVQGITFVNEAVGVEEAENCTAEQIMMILTRLGVGSKMMFTGDPNQIQLRQKSKSGFQRLIDIVPSINSMYCTTLLENRRDPIVQEIIEKYNK